MYLEIPLPMQGISEGLPVVNEAITTSGYMLNCRPRDVLERRIRLGQRPGMKKAYSQQIGGTSSPIVWLGSVTVVD